MATVSPPVHAATLAALDASVPHTIGHLLRKVTDTEPNRVAFSFFDHDVELTYSELDELVRRVANGLIRHGVRKGTHVAMMLPNCVEFPVTWLAVAWIGAVTIQVNPAFTGAELDYVLNDADADFIVLDETALEAFEAMGERSARLPDDNVIVRFADRSGSGGSPHSSWGALATADPLDAEPLPTVGPHDLVSLLYTSGTTGFPKGCMLDHRYWTQIAVVNLFSQGDHTPRNALIYEPMFYIQGNALFLAALLANATVHCSARPSITNFLKWVQRYNIDYCAFPVPAAQAMEDAPAAMGSSLEFVHAWYFHGDALQRMEARYRVTGRDSYAMTENGLITYVPVDRPDLARTGSVGVAAPWREIRVVDPDGNDVANGEIGEAWTAGSGHFHGYYRKTAANRASFVDIWFRTGDLVRRDPNDGGYYLVGRLKDMIKRSGENVSAAEVEDCLSALAGVAYAAVVGVRDLDRGEEVKAYLQLRPGATPSVISPDVVFAHCADHLAGFKIPRYLHYVDALPMTASGDKVAKTRLTAGVEDLRLGSFDRIDGFWH